MGLLDSLKQLFGSPDQTSQDAPVDATPVAEEAPAEAPMMDEAPAAPVVEEPAAVVEETPAMDAAPAAPVAEESPEAPSEDVEAPAEDTPAA